VDAADFGFPSETPDSAPSFEIPVTLAGNEYGLRFVGKHWFDLKTILGSWDGLNVVKPIVCDA
jgi:hypothetical protein